MIVDAHHQRRCVRVCLNKAQKNTLLKDSCAHTDGAGGNGGSSYRSLHRAVYTRKKLVRGHSSLPCETVSVIYKILLKYPITSSEPKAQRGEVSYNIYTSKVWYILQIG